MAKAYRHTSEFGPGKRVPLNRDQRNHFNWQALQARHGKRLTANGLIVAKVMSSALGADGQLHMSHATIATKAGCHVATVRRALDQLAALKLITWVRRLIRRGQHVFQTSSAYVLTPGTPGNRPKTADSHFARGVQLPIERKRASTPDIAAEPAPIIRAEGLAQLNTIAARRLAAIYGHG
jgi:hypothetical protein